MIRFPVLLLLVPTIAFACDCPPAPRCGALSSEAKYFVGMTVGERKVPAAKAGQVDFVDYSVRVTESFAAGVAVGSIAHVWSDPSSGCSWTFDAGATYLFETHADAGRLYTSQCTFTAAMKDAGPVLAQLRAIRAGQRLPSLVGTLREDGPGVALRNASVTARSATGQSSTAKTDAQGMFVFATLAPGAYALKAELPAGMKLLSGADNPARVVIPSGAVGGDASCRAYLDAVRR